MLNLIGTIHLHRTVFHFQVQFDVCMYQLDSHKHISSYFKAFNFDANDSTGNL